MAVFDDVKTLVVEQLRVDAGEVKMESHFVNDLNADSLDVAEFVMALEEKFGLEVPEEKAQSLQTVGDVVKYIEENKK